MAGKRTLKQPKSRTSSDHGGQTQVEIVPAAHGDSVLGEETGADGGLLTGNSVVAGPPAVYPALVEVLG